MSRNPYLASSRPTSSFTRSSRTSSRTGALGAGSGGGLLGRSRSSATLGGLASQLASSGITSSPYSSSSLSAYLPGSSWQRSSSSSRLGVASTSATSARASSPYSAQRSANTQRDQSVGDAPDERRAATSALSRSTSSHTLGKAQRDEDESNVIIQFIEFPFAANRRERSQLSSTTNRHKSFSPCPQIVTATQKLPAKKIESTTAKSAQHQVNQIIVAVDRLRQCQSGE